MEGRRLLFRFISGIITLLIVYLLVSKVFVIDFATSLEPGWHTTIFPPKTAFTPIIITIIICILFTWLIFKSLLWILIKIFSLHPDGQRTNG